MLTSLADLNFLSKLISVTLRTRYPDMCSMLSLTGLEDVLSSVIVFVEFPDLLRLRGVNRFFVRAVDTFRQPFEILIGAATHLVEQALIRDKFLSERMRKFLSKADLLINEHLLRIPPKMSLCCFHSIVLLVDNEVNISQAHLDALRDEKYVVRFRRDAMTLEIKTAGPLTKQLWRVFVNAHAIEGIVVDSIEQLIMYWPFFCKCQWVKIIIDDLSKEDFDIIAEAKKHDTRQVKWILKSASADFRSYLCGFDEIGSIHFSDNRVGDISGLQSVKSVSVTISANVDQFALLRQGCFSFETLELSINTPTAWDVFLRNIDILDKYPKWQSLILNINVEIASLNLKPMFEKVGDRLRNLTVKCNQRRECMEVVFPQEVALRVLKLSGPVRIDSRVTFTAESVDSPLLEVFTFPNCKRLCVDDIDDSGFEILQNLPPDLKLLIILAASHKYDCWEASRDGKMPGCAIGFRSDAHRNGYSILYTECIFNYFNNFDDPMDYFEDTEGYEEDISTYLHARQSMYPWQTRK